MSRTKKSFEAQVENTEQELNDIAEQRYQEEQAFFEKGYYPAEDVLPKTPSESIWTAIAGFQSEVPILIQNTSTNKYTYVDLAEIVRIITPILRKYNLAYIQPLTGESEIETILFHTLTGEKISSKVRIPIVKLDFMNEYQSIGSAISYYRRYSISSMLNLISEKDTDATHQTKPNSAPSKPVGNPAYAKQSITNENLEKAVKMINEGQYTIEQLGTKYIFTDTQMTYIKNNTGK